MNVLQRPVSFHKDDLFEKQLREPLQTFLETLWKLANKRPILIPSPPVIYVSVKIHLEITEFVTVQRENVRQHPPNRPAWPKLPKYDLISLAKQYNEALKSVILKKLLAVKELRGKGHSLPRTVNKLAELKESLDEFTVIVEKIHSFYAAFELGYEHPVDDLPSRDDINHVKQQVAKIKQQLKPQELNELFLKYGDDFKTTNDEIYCSILGMDEKMGKQMYALDEHKKQHQTAQYFLESFIEYDGENQRMDGDSLVKSLKELLFTESTAVLISQNVPDNLKMLQKPSFWAIRYLNYAFQYLPLLVDQVLRYPFNEEEHNTWYAASLKKDPYDCDSDEEIPIKMINVSSDESKVHDELRYLGSDEKYQLLFHGTDHKSAKSILTDGIMLTQGSLNQDFSNGDGFYLSENFEDAQLWGKAARGNKHLAVIVYKVKKSLLSEVAGLDLTGNKPLWEQVIRYFRSGRSQMRQVQKQIEDAPFIRGSICTNPETAEVLTEGQEIQLCLKDDDFAEKFSCLENVSFVVFYGSNTD